MTFLQFKTVKQVTRDQFFAAMRDRNVHPSIRRGPWPYTSDWKLNAGTGPVIGRSEERLLPGSALTETLYFLQ
jgi:hypothetical protein